MAINITTTFPGEFLDKILTKATIGNELVESNLIHVEMNVLKKLYFGKLLATDMLQHRVEMPTSETAKGNFNYTENYLEPKDVMAYTRYNPRTFESIWRKWQPTGPMVNETWGPKAQADFLGVFADKVAEEVGYQMINGIYSEELPPSKPRSGMGQILCRRGNNCRFFSQSPSGPFRNRPYASVSERFLPSRIYTFRKPAGLQTGKQKEQKTEKPPSSD